MLMLADAEVVLPDRVLNPGAVLIADGRIAGVEDGRPAHAGAEVVPLAGRRIVPGFVDAHVHGLLGRDVLEGPDALAWVARAMPRFGVTAFAPTAVACDPPTLRRLLDGVGTLRARTPVGARVLPAHLESSFINPEYGGAQPRSCLRLPPTRLPSGPGWSRARAGRSTGASGKPFEADDILAELDRRPAAVGVVTLAPELPGALPLIGWLIDRRIQVSLGHSGASFEEGLAAIEAGARRATHLFNRMPPLHHRAPGLAGAVLQSARVAVEVIGDGYHLHPSIIRMVVETKQPSRTMAVTDGTAAAGMPAGSRARLGDQPLVVGPRAAQLEDGTLAGSTTTMDRVFGILCDEVGLSTVDAAWLCATTPARRLGDDESGAIEPGKRADLAVLGPDGRVERTYVGGSLVFSVDSPEPRDGAIDGTS